MFNFLGVDGSNGGHEWLIVCDTEAVPKERLAVITSKYIIGYGLGATGNAVVISFADKFGIGWFETLSKFASPLISCCVRRPPSHRQFQTLTSSCSVPDVHNVRLSGMDTCPIWT